MNDYVRDLERELIRAGQERQRRHAHWTIAGVPVSGPRVGRGRMIGAIAGGLVAIAAVAVVIGVWSGSTPPAAQAFPVLDRAQVLTPLALSRALVLYGVGPDNAGLDIAHGRPFATPWGIGYVLTNRGPTAICATAPESAQRWAASCAQTSIAKREGTSPVEFAYNRTSDTARYLVLLPARATATARAQGGKPRPVAIHDGVLALVVHGHTLLTTQIGDHRHTIELVASHAQQSGPAASAAPGGENSAASTTASASR